MPQDRVPQHKRRLATDNEEVKKDIQKKPSHKTIGNPPKDSDKDESNSGQKEE